MFFRITFDAWACQPVSFGVPWTFQRQLSLYVPHTTHSTTVHELLGMNAARKRRGLHGDSKDGDNEQFNQQRKQSLERLALEMKDAPIEVPLHTPQAHPLRL